MLGTTDHTGSLARPLPAVQGLSAEDLHEIRSRLEAVFGPRLRRIVACGSRARGDAGDDSDLDLFVLLDECPDWGRDLDAIIEALYPLQLRLPFPIAAQPVEADVYDAAEYPLYIEAARDGLRI